MKKILLLITITLFSFFGYSQMYNYDNINAYSKTLISFEEEDTLPYFFSIDTSIQNIWQIGKPQKLVFGTAFSPINVIVTDTINTYPTNNLSYFDINISEMTNYWYNIPFGIDFTHKYNTDTLKDGGFITISHDNGETWENILFDYSYFEESPAVGWADATSNFYTNKDSLINDNFGFSGNSNGWTTTILNWYYLPVLKTGQDKDTTIIRFNFISDSLNTNKDGWMIDDLKLYFIDVGSSISETYKEKISIYPNPAKNTTTLKLETFFKEIELTILDLNGRIVQKKSFSKTKTIKLNLENIDKGMYFIKIKTDKNTFGLQRLIVK